MLSIEQSVVIDRPVEQVFDYVTNVENMVEWTGPTIEASQTSEGPPGVGATTSRISNFLGRRIDTQMQITEFEPNKLVVSKAISGPMPEF